MQENNKMKLTFFIIISLFIAFTVYLFILGLNSKNGSAPGLINNKLSHCPDTPNCVNSEYPEQQAHYISPINIISKQKISTSPLPRLKDIIQDMGGTVIKQDEIYLAATFTSNIFRFVDDIEIRFDNEKNLIHFRSASRVGRSDMGVNKKRVNLIKQLYTKQTGSDSNSN